MTTDQINNRLEELQVSLNESQEERKQIDNLLEQQVPEPILFTDNKGKRHETFQAMKAANQRYHQEKEDEEEHQRALAAVEKLDMLLNGICRINYTDSLARGARRHNKQKA